MTVSPVQDRPRAVDLDEDVYRYLLQHTQHIGESASSILRRLLSLEPPAGSTNGRVPAAGNGRSAAETTHKPSVSLLEYIGSAEFRFNRNTTDKFLAILGFLHRENPESFSKVLEISGRKRVYFGRSESEVAKSGKSTHPQQIPGSGYWVMTNADTEQKQGILTRVLERLGYPTHVANQVSTALS